MKRPLEERFREKVAEANEAGCTLWIAGKDDGYGRFRMGDHTVLAHRLAWEMQNGPIPEGMCVCHRCDVPSCVNVDHLFLGTHDDNMADRHAKGRNPRTVGTLNGRAKLSESDVIAIFNSPGLQREIAAQYGITQVQVSQIKRGVQWAHVTRAAA